MPVFKTLLAVGVSGAITFIYLGQGIAVPISVESPDKRLTSNSISQTGFKQNAAKTHSASSTADAASTSSRPSDFSRQPSPPGSVSETSEVSIKQNAVKPTPQQPTSPGAILNTLTSGATTPENPRLNKAESSLSDAFKQNPTKSPVTGSTFQRILDKFIAPSSDEPAGEVAQASQNPSQPSVETAFKQNPAKPVPPASANGGRILNNLAAGSSDEPAGEVNQPSPQPSLETAFKQNPVKPVPPDSSIPVSLAPRGTSAGFSQRPSPVPVENPPQSGDSTPNLLELPRTLPESISQVPPQISQDPDTPTLEVPDLNPPPGPFPLPTPNGTLQTSPPPITLPSYNPLYTPNQPREVEIRETVPITLPQAVDLARRNNEEIRVFELQVAQNLAALRQAQADLYPTLSYISTLTRAFSAGEDIANSARNREVRARATPEQAISLSRTFGSTTFENTLQFQYDFDVSGARGARIRAAEEQLRLARLEFERSVEQLRLDVTEAYYNLQEADAEVEIQRAAVRNAQKSLEDAEALERAGVGTRFEVLQARVTLSRVQQDLTNAISNQRTRRRELANILNVNQNVNLIAADAIALAGAWEFTLDESIVLAYKNRAELQQELVNRNLAEQRRIAARAAQRPNLTTTANYNVLGRLDDNSDPFANQGWADGYAIQLQLRWNFFDGGLAKANARQQEINIAIAEERYSELLNDVRLEVESAFYDLQATFENIGVANLGVEEATEALRLARLRFQAGVGTQLDVINQETDLTRAQNQLLQAIIGYNRSLSRLQRAVSNLPDNNLQALP